MILIRTREKHEGFQNIEISSAKASDILNFPAREHKLIANVNLPNSLTFARIIVVPLIVVVLLTTVMETWFGVSSYAIAIGLFLIAALTDVLDGHLARKRDQVSTLGKFLDPIADKLLISASLIVLVEKNLAPSWAVVVIISREFIVTGLRSVAASEGLVIQARNIGKIKMWAQSVAIVALLVAAATGTPQVSNFGRDFPAFEFWKVGEVHTAFENLFSLSLTTNDWKVFGYLVGRGGLWLAVILSVWSMLDYFKYFFEERQRTNDKVQPE